MSGSAPSPRIPERDLIDRIAEALPADVRADYYRELRHCRSLPDNDEMLRILRAMQFLTLLIHEAPGRMTLERERLQQNLAACTRALEAVERRLEDLPQGVARSLDPEQVAARINESLRQQFAQSTIPQSGAALAATAAEIQRCVAEFAVAGREISGVHHGTAAEARRAVGSIESAIVSATQTSRIAAAELCRAAARLHWTSLALGAAGTFLLGILSGQMLFR